MTTTPTARPCAMCDAPITTHAYLVDASRRAPGSRAWHARRELICPTCWQAGNTDGYATTGGATKTFQWTRLAGQGAPIEPTPCGSCGILLVRGSSGLKRVSCSNSCLVAITRQSGRPDARPCEECGGMFTPARSSGRFCSATCRQREHRRKTRAA